MSIPSQSPDSKIGPKIIYHCLCDLGIPPHFQGLMPYRTTPLWGSSRLVPVDCQSSKSRRVDAVDGIQLAGFWLQSTGSV